MLKNVIFIINGKAGDDILSCYQNEKVDYDNIWNDKMCVYNRTSIYDENIALQYQYDRETKNIKDVQKQTELNGKIRRFKN